MVYEILAKWRDFPWFLLISFCAILDHTPNCKRQGKIFQKLQWISFEPCRPHSSCTLTESLLQFLIIFSSLAYFPFIWSHLSFYSHVLYILYLPIATSFLSVYFHLPFLVKSFALPVIAKLGFFMIISHKKEYSLFFDWRVSLIWIPPALWEGGGILTIKLFLLLAVVLLLVDGCIISIYVSQK